MLKHIAEVQSGSEIPGDLSDLYERMEGKKDAFGT